VVTAVQRGLEPRKAKIPLLSLDRFNIGDCRFIITSHVDTVNDYGAPIRLHFVGVERYDKSARSWTIEPQTLAIGSQAKIGERIDVLISQ
jgi:hypothetical protein